MPAHDGWRKAQEADLMSTARAAGVLGALILCGLLLLSSLALASKDTFFATIQGALLWACSQQAAERSGDDAVVFLKACNYVVRALRGVTSTSPEDVAQALFEGLGKNPHFEVPCPEGEECVTPTTRCDRCVQAVQNLEIVLAANNTVEDIQDALQAACDKRFSDPAEASQCLQVVNDLPLPAAVDFMLGNFPPLVACQELKACPLP
jgi:hypothetical protein